MSVLRKDLPPKKEFVITVPLTDLQRKAYSVYVKSVTSNNVELTKKGDVYQATVWSWLAVLSLLCNHPDPFMSKLMERKPDLSSVGTAVSREGTTDQDDIAIDLNPSASVWTVGVSESLVHEEEKLLAELAEDIKSVDLSHKTKILCQILDASKAANDKVLVFSQSIPTLDFLEGICQNQRRNYARLDGKTPMGQRQALSKKFNNGNIELYLISTAAGGLGLNLYGANRVVIFDFKFNPILEEQAVGRAYRIGQQKEVFVYRFVAGGTFEDLIHNKAIFKKQLASRVVDKKNPIRWAQKKRSDFLFEPKDIEQQDLLEFESMDPLVLDKILASQIECNSIRAIVQTDTFEKDDDDILTAEEMLQVKQMLQDEKLKRSNPQAYEALMRQRNYAGRPATPSDLISGVSRHFPPSAAVQNQAPGQFSLQETFQAAPQAPPRSVSGPILPPPRPVLGAQSITQNHTFEFPRTSQASSDLSVSKSSTATPTLTAVSKVPSQTPDRTVSRPSTTAQASGDRPPSQGISLTSPRHTAPGALNVVPNSSLRPALKESLHSLPDHIVTRRTTAAGQSPRPSHIRDPRPVQQRGSSPVMGANTKKSSETSESTSPLSTNARATKSSVEANALSPKKLNSTGSADQSVNNQSGSRSATSKHYNRTTSNDAIKVCISSTPSSDATPKEQKSSQWGNKVPTELKEPSTDNGHLLTCIDTGSAQPSEPGGRRDKSSRRGDAGEAVTLKASFRKPRLQSRVAPVPVDQSSSPNTPSASSSGSQPREDVLHSAFQS